MAISSINLELANQNNFLHNSRIKIEKLKYIFREHSHENIYDRSAQEAQNLFNQYIQEAFENYKTRTKQKIQTDPKKFLWSAVVNLNAGTTMEHLQTLTAELEKRFGWRCVQIAIHNDEGERGENSELKRKNRHAHLEFCMLDKDGIYCFKKRDFRKKQMSELQTLTAEILEMERGHNYYVEQELYKKPFSIAPKPTPKPKRLGARQYAEAKQAEQKEKANHEHKLKELNSQYRAKLKAFEAKRSDYALYEAIIKELRQVMKENLNQTYFDRIFQRIDNEIITGLEANFQALPQEQAVAIIVEPIKTFVEDQKNSFYQTKKTINELKVALKLEKEKNDELEAQVKENATTAKEIAEKVQNIEMQTIKIFDEATICYADGEYGLYLENKQNGQQELYEQAQKLPIWAAFKRGLWGSIAKKFNELVECVNKLRNEIAELKRENEQLKNQNSSYDYDDYYNQSPKMRM